MTVCTANNTDVWLIPAGDSPTTTMLTSGGSGTISFSGGSCTNCGVAMDGVNNQAVVALAASSGVGGYQFLNLANNTFGSVIPTQNASGEISEDVLIDPTHHLLLSASEDNNYEIGGISNVASPVFYENAVTGVDGEFDSSGEDCGTGIAGSG